MTETWRDWEPILLQHGYRHAFSDGLNRFYVSGEAAELASRFPAEPAAWDAVQHLWDFGCAPDRPDHPDHELARCLVEGFLAALPTLDHALLAKLIGRGRAKVAPGAPIERLLFGTAEFPGAADAPTGAGAANSFAQLLDSDRFRAALARIASSYDGGHLME
jgi:hypothetical protein